MSKTVDLRSDTVTRPVPEMRRAIAQAEVGDDVFGDDPTIVALEKKVASLLQKEAALFVPSGTMGNQVALAAHTQHGDEVVIDRQSHVFNYEVAAASALSGVQFNPLDGRQGVITADQIAPHIRPRNIHQPVTRAIAVENTHNRGGGHVYPIDELRRIKALADDNDIRVHLDGARLANAVAATGIPFHDYAACVDTVSMCFSKGLGAPVGSVVVGDDETIECARKKRKQLGGGMRQAGFLAAAALYALDHHVERLAVDHENATKLGEAVSKADGLELVYPVETNIVIFRVDPQRATAETFLAFLQEHNVVASTSGPFLRMVTHHDVAGSDIDHVVRVLSEFSAA